QRGARGGSAGRRDRPDPARPGRPEGGGRKQNVAAEAAAAALEEAAHRQRLTTLLRLARAPGASRRGPGRQQLRRELECQLRRAPVGLADRLADRDWQPSAIAGRLGLSLLRRVQT